jgi:hypothetical protein
MKTLESELVALTHIPHTLNARQKQVCLEAAQVIAELRTVMAGLRLAERMLGIEGD